MKMTVVSLVLILLMCSCATETLWKQTDPHEYVKINFTDISEKELVKRRAKYIRDDNQHAYYVRKNSFEKFKDYSARILGTPITLVIDATVVVIFAVANSVTDQAIDREREKGCNEDPNCRDRMWNPEF
jgi:hypothetical protein